MIKGNPSALGGLDVDEQALFLNVLAVGGVMVIQPRFADAHKFGCCERRDQFIDTGQGSSAALIGWVPAA